MNTPKYPQIPGITLTNTEILLVAKSINVPPAALKAVQVVETAGRGGFIASGKPTILFEGHIFWKQLRMRKINPMQHTNGNADILYPKWDRSKYQGGQYEYARLKRACSINEEAAYSSASWGLFQIMGFNHSQCGIANIHEFVKLMAESEYQQLKLTVAFLKNNNLLSPLRQCNWNHFAQAYNGAGYAQNHYAEKLSEAYKQAVNLFR
jgi:hypothetical protein